MPITDRNQAKESGFAQVRKALQKFEGTVVSAEFDKYPPKMDDDGKPMPEKEYLDIVCVNNKALEVTEELSMDISEEWKIRVNCSDYAGSFWVEDFLASADKAKILIPDELVDKRIVWIKATREGTVPMYNTTNFIIDSIKGKAKATPKVVSSAAPAQLPTANEAEEAPGGAVDPMAVALELAVGKTEPQFRTAISLDEQFKGSPLLPMAKAGVITQSLVNDGKLVLVKEGNKQIYQKP